MNKHIFLGAWIALLSTFGSVEAKTPNSNKEHPVSPGSDVKSSLDRCARADSDQWFGCQTLLDARRARCATAICWGDGSKWGVEPLFELPVGKTFALNNTDGALGNWIDSHNFTVKLAGGLRFWLWYDWMSVAIYFSTPDLTGSNKIHVQGSAQEYSASSINRPYPGVALGFLGDTLWIGLDYQDLRNSTPDQIDPNYRRDQVVARALSLTVALAAGTAFRNGIGTLRPKSADAEVGIARGAQDGGSADTGIHAPVDGGARSELDSGRTDSAVAGQAIDAGP